LAAGLTGCVLAFHWFMRQLGRLLKSKECEQLEPRIESASDDWKGLRPENAHPVI
jgi:hypothetical protein